jgi:LAO/AO transport system kinase
MTCSALTHHNIPEVWKMVTDHVENIRKSGYLQKKRAKQDVQTMYDSIEQALRNDFFENSLIKDMLALTENDVKDKRTSAYMAANKLLETYFNMLKK